MMNDAQRLRIAEEIWSMKNFNSPALHVYRRPRRASIFDSAVSLVVIVVVVATAAAINLLFGGY